MEITTKHFKLIAQRAHFIIAQAIHFTAITGKFALRSQFRPYHKIINLNTTAF